MSKIWIASGIIFFPRLAVAHLEHVAGDDSGFVHYLLDPAHVALTGAALFLFLTVHWIARVNHSVDRGSP